MLSELITRIVGAVAFVGGFIFVWGAIRFGGSFSDGLSGNGNEIKQGVGLMAAGAIIAVAAGYFGMIDTSWAY